MNENQSDSCHSCYGLPLSLSKLSVNWTRINYAYASIYTKSFLDMLYAIKQDNVEKKESLYDSWLTDLDGIFGKELRSSQFTSMLEDYLKSLAEFRATCRNIGYPADYYEMLFYNMKKYFLNALTLSIQDPAAYYYFTLLKYYTVGEGFAYCITLIKMMLVIVVAASLINLQS